MDCLLMSPAEASEAKAAARTARTDGSMMIVAPGVDQEDYQPKQQQLS